MCAISMLVCFCVIELELELSSREATWRDAQVRLLRVQSAEETIQTLQSQVHSQQPD